MSELPDDALVERARRPGAEGLAAYEVIVSRHQGRLLRLVTYLLSDSVEAEDIVQEVFLRAHASLDRYQPGTNFSAWLRVIATRLAFNFRRDHARVVRRDRPDDDDEESPLIPSSTRGAVEWTLGQLSYPFREILVLRFVEEMSLDEIAETLKIGLSAAKMRLSRARASFFEVYQREHGPLPEHALSEGA